MALARQSKCAQGQTGYRHHRDKLLPRAINAANYSYKVLIAQTAIHINFLLSAMAIAATGRIVFPARSSG